MPGTTVPETNPMHAPQIDPDWGARTRHPYKQRHQGTDLGGNGLRGVRAGLWVHVDGIGGWIPPAWTLQFRRIISEESTKHGLPHWQTWKHRSWKNGTTRVLVGILRWPWYGWKRK